MIIVTGAAGFIGSCLISRLNQEGLINVIATDDFSSSQKLRNLNQKQISGVVHRDHLSDWMKDHHRRIDHVFHLGARTDTVEKNVSIFDQLNLHYSQKIWEICSDFEIPLTYASSAATYGDGSLGYQDSHEIISELEPLNPYGDSKNQFDLWVLGQSRTPPHWAGLKFFNVYGPNEYHKDRMASVIFHAYRQISDSGKMKLFRSHRDDIEDGHQSRDFIYIKDILNICLFCMRLRPENGIYNAGTGEARTFLDLVNATYDAMELQPDIEFIDTPKDIRGTYQYYTEATMDKLYGQGFDQKFHSLESGIKEYVQDYLMSGTYY